MQVRWAVVVGVYTILVMALVGYLLYNYKNTAEHFVTIQTPLVNFETIAKVKSKYQEIQIVDSNPKVLGRCMIIGGEVQLCQRDEHRYHEMMVHFPVQYLHPPSPKRVLIVGGGDCMTLREVLKYKSIEHVTVLELDPDICNLAEEHFGVQCHRKNSPKVSYMFGDAAETIDRVSSDPSDAYDLIIVDSTEDNSSNLSIDQPHFFEKLKARLRHTGVLVKNGERFEEVLATVFPHTMAYGYPSITFDTRYKFVIASSIDIKEKEIHTANWEQLKIPTSYYRVKKHGRYISWYSTYRFDEDDA